MTLAARTAAAKHAFRLQALRSKGICIFLPG
jgi:hypothetical protein